LNTKGDILENVGNQRGWSLLTSIVVKKNTMEVSRDRETILVTDIL